MNYEEQVPEKQYQATEFSALAVGQSFFLRKPRIDERCEKLVKIDTIKTSTGGWANSRNIFGTSTFTQYDRRVFVQID